MVEQVRVLQVVADTDEASGESPLGLHEVLAEQGFEVRTVALGPGRIGELAGSVPVMSPSRRSIAATTELRRESRWADVLLFRGRAAVPPGLAWVAGLPPCVLLIEPNGRSPRRTRWRSGEVAVVFESEDGGGCDPGSDPEGADHSSQRRLCARVAATLRRAIR
jgi:hypothetical protein